MKCFSYKNIIYIYIYICLSLWEKEQWCATITNNYKYFSSSLFLADNVLSQKTPSSSSSIIHITLNQRNANFLSKKKKKRNANLPQIQISCPSSFIFFTNIHIPIFIFIYTEREYTSLSFQPYYS